jgi:Animal haem peroxidase
MQSSFPLKRPQRLWWGEMLDGAGKPFSTPTSTPATVPKSAPGSPVPKTRGARSLQSSGAPSSGPKTSDRDAVASRNDVHNLYLSFDPKDRYRADDLVSEDGIVDPDALHRLLAVLSRRINLSSPAADSISENKNLPSGYTYLMQLIAHDLVDSVTSVRRDGADLRPTTRNVRQSALMLDTLYGPGPEELPHAYAVTDADISAAGIVPRSQLRVGVRQPQLDQNPTTYCPYRDLARMAPLAADGLAADNARLLTETGIADPRNDSHAFMSQLTVLFVLLHNQILRLLTAGKLTAGASQTDDAQRRFLCVRFVVTLIYRNIIQNDVLPRILDAKVFDRYNKETKVFFDGDKAVPIEFTHGAFRFGHAMVRDAYMVRSETKEKTLRALDFNPLRLPGELPVNETWFIDWARFFETTRPAAVDFKRNYSHVLGPHYPRALLTPVVFPPRSSRDWEGLANRDLLSSAYAGLLSVRALTAKMQTMFTPAVVPSFDSRSKEILAWLDKEPSDELTPDDRRRIANDPPLPFFVMFEAEAANAGMKLGPVGSIIVAETIYGALRSNPTGFEVPGLSLKQRIALCAETFFDDQDDTDRTTAITQAAKDALSVIGEITSMPELLDFLATNGAFTAQ